MRTRLHGAVRGRPWAARLLAGLAAAFGPPEPDAGRAAGPPLPDVAAEVRRWGLELPAEVAAEAHRPLLFVYAQATLAASPLLDALVPGRRASALAAALEDPGALEAFLGQIRRAPPVPPPSPAPSRPPLRGPR